MKRQHPWTLMDAVNRLRGHGASWIRQRGLESKHPIMQVAAQIATEDPPLWKELCARSLLAAQGEKET